MIINSFKFKRLWNLYKETFFLATPTLVPPQEVELNQSQEGASEEEGQRCILFQPQNKKVKAWDQRSLVNWIQTLIKI